MLLYRGLKLRYVIETQEVSMAGAPHIFIIDDDAEICELSVERPG